MPRFDLANYVPVQERITEFWRDHPDGAIRTSLASDPTDWTKCRYRAEVYTHRDHAAPDATGYAFEIAGGGGANQTAHEENGETSSVGRALANLGYATSAEKRPSREEMAKANGATARLAPAPQAASQAPQRPANVTTLPGPAVERIDADKVKTLQELCDRKGVSALSICKRFKITSLLGLAPADYWVAKKGLEGMPDAEPDEEGERELAAAEATP